MKDTEIKLRAWHDRTKTMSYFDLEQLLCASGWIGDFDKTLGYEWMRATGLKDKNGRDIYYDDIVSFEWKEENEEYNGVALVIETMSYGAAILDDGIIQEIWEDDALWSFEVIGNCHENPDLIED